MKHNNLKKPAAVLTALALAAALLAGCGAPSDSMAASSAPAESEAVSTETPAESADEGDADEVAAKKCADLIDAIYVQERTDDTDAQCEAAKQAWDTLTDTQKELVEGENADPDYFGRNTGDANLDDSREGGRRDRRRAAVSDSHRRQARHRRARRGAQQDRRKRAEVSG